MAIDFSDGNAPFTDQDELLDRFSDILDLHLYYLYKCHPWLGSDPSLQRVMSAAVSREEFESGLLRASDSRCFMRLDDGERAELTALRNYFVGRIRATAAADILLPVILLIGAFSLDGFRIFVILSLFCCEIDRKYERLFAYLQEDAGRNRPTAETAVRLFAGPFDRVSDYWEDFSADSVLMRYLLISDGAGFGEAVLRLSPRILSFLTGDGRAESAYEYWYHTSALHPLCADKELAKRIFNTVRLPAEGKTTLVFLTGRRGSGKRFQVKYCAAALGEDVIFADASELCPDEEPERAFHDAVCMRTLGQCALCLTGFETLLREENKGKLSRLSALIRQSGGWLGERLYVTSEEKWRDARLGDRIVRLDFEIPDADEGARLSLWEFFMDKKPFSDETDLREMAAKFRFSAGQIRDAAERAADLSKMSGEPSISADTLHECCYAQVVSGLDTLAAPMKAAYRWEDLVLPEREIGLLKEACAHVKYRHLVYGAWGFSEKAAYGRGLSVLFSGPPGTGKTMAAQVIANRLRMRIYKIQLSQVVSKYIGETEKNLRRLFVEAREASCILFFDEMDALFGKRSEVKDSNDRNANIETAYLLQQLEEYDGVILMATNLLQNIDEAFMRRIMFVVSFPFPDGAARRRLWKKMLETRAPAAEDIDYDFLAENFKISGGEIKNCAVRAAFLAAAENAPISMRHLLQSVVNEQRKNNVVVLREELKEYADLVFSAN